MTYPDIKINLDKYIDHVDCTNYEKSKNVSKWIIEQRKLDKQSDQNSKHRTSKGEHPIFVGRGEVYVIDYGSNVGKEFMDLHLGLIVQNDKGNIYGDTTIVLPITDYKSDEKFDNNVHFKLYNSQFESVERDGLDKNPSKIKIADITTVDKSRIGRKVGKLKPEVFKTIHEKLIKILNR